MTAEPIARVIDDLRKGRVRFALNDHAVLRESVDRIERSEVVVDATAIYRSLVAKEQPVDLYGDHPCIASPWQDAALCYLNQHGNAIVMQLSARPWPAGRRWQTPNEVAWGELRWLLEAFVWVGGRGGDGRGFPTTGPCHLMQYAVGPNGEPADLHYVHLVPEYPLESWDMAQLTLLSSLNFMSCFVAETPIVTSEGVLPIGKLAGRDVQVLTREPHAHAAAKFAPARVESFGKQPIVELDVRRNGITRTYRTTPGHRWFVRRRPKNGPRIAEVTTADLRAGDRLVTVRPRSRADACRISGVGVAHGLVYGDGTRRAHPDGCLIDIYGDDRHEMLRFFPEPVVTEMPPGAYPSDPHNTPRLRVSHLPRSFKDLPPEDESSPYLYSFLAGWFAADGDVQKTGSVNLSCAKPEPLEWVHRVALTRLGIVTGQPKRTMRRGVGGVVSPLWTIRFDRGSLMQSFFVRAHHRERFRSRAVKAEPNHWEVIAVRSTGVVEDVFCAVVPGTEAFVLDGMVLTGNCRNVELTEPQRKRPERRRLERLGVRVQTLTVRPMSRRSAGGTPGAAGAVPLHSVRGHFAEYGERYGKGKLFGKLEGRYWIPAHARGSADEGEIRKDYVLKP